MDQETYNRKKIQLIAALISLGSLIIFGTIFFHYTEGWTWASAFYFSVATLTTVGYGDLTPATDSGRLAVAIFILIGVSVAVTALGIIGSLYLQNRQIDIAQRHASRLSKKLHHKHDEDTDETPPQ